MQNLLQAAAVPQSKHAGVQKALHTAFPGAEVQSITALSGGLSTGLVYKVLVEGQSFVLRINMNPNALSDPVREYQCMRLAAEAGVAPAVYYTNEDDAIAITQFIEPVPLRDAFNSSREQLLVHLAETIKTIHATPRFPELVNFMDGVDGFIADFQASKRLPERATAEHFAYYAEIQKHYPRYEGDLVSSHNDLNYNNILFDGKKVWIIDWEAAFANDRYVDLANVGNGFVATEELEERFLRAYFGDTLDEGKWARYYLMRQTCHFFYAMVMFKMIDVQLPQGATHDASMDTPRLSEFHQQIGAGEISLASYEGKLLYAKVILNEALHNMKSPRFQRALQQIKVTA
jgi:thiamine kinase-like enzyme